MPDANQLPHLLVDGRFQTEKYTYAGPIPMGEVPLPVRDRASHGTSLRDELFAARQQNEKQRGITTAADQPARIILEVCSEPDFELALGSLEPRSQGVELACVREERNQRIAVIHVPEGKLNYFVRRVEQYMGEQARSGKPKNQDLIDRIAEIRLATLRSFWTDEGVTFPTNDQPIWWEVWLRAESDQGPWETFCMLAEAAGIRVARETIRFRIDWSASVLEQPSNSVLQRRSLTCWGKFEKLSRTQRSSWAWPPESKPNGPMICDDELPHPAMMLRQFASSTAASFSTRCCERHWPLTIVLNMIRHGR